jgi:hypothetical protein
MAIEFNHAIKGAPTGPTRPGRKRARSTIKAHIGEILRKFAVQNRTRVVFEVISPFESASDRMSGYGA